MAKTMTPAPPPAFSINAVNSETELNTHAILIQNSAVDDKLATIEKRLAQLSFQNNKSKSTPDLRTIGRQSFNNQD
jgi:hypothetical protein